MENQEGALEAECIERDCRGIFEISEGEQNFYEGKGYPLPKRCKDCRAKRKQRREQAAE